jgi:hypothetical protein
VATATPHTSAARGQRILTGMVDLRRDARERVGARLLDPVPGRTGKADADSLTDRRGDRPLRTTHPGAQAQGAVAAPP